MLTRAEHFPNPGFVMRALHNNLSSLIHLTRGDKLRLKDIWQISWRFFCANIIIWQVIPIVDLWDTVTKFNEYFSSFMMLRDQTIVLTISLVVTGLAAVPALVNMLRWKFQPVRPI